jgi:hypothetical protein
VFTKCSLVWDESDHSVPPRRVGTPANLRREVEASLRRLQVERLCPDVLMALASCEHRRDFSSPCGARYELRVDPLPEPAHLGRRGASIVELGHSQPTAIEPCVMLQVEQRNSGCC